MKNEATGSTRFQFTMWKKTVRIAPTNTMTDSYTRLPPEAQPYLNWMTRTPISKRFNFAYRSIPCPNTLAAGVRYLFTLLKFHSIVELYPTFLLC